MYFLFFLFLNIEEKLQIFIIHGQIRSRPIKVIISCP